MLKGDGFMKSDPNMLTKNKTTPKVQNSPPTRCPHKCRLDAQMGAKAPILLDFRVRTSISDLEAKS